MTNCEDHWHSVEDKLTPGLMVKLFEFFIMKNLELTMQLVKLQLHYAIYRLRFYSHSLTYILSLSNLHNNVASIQQNRGDKSHRVIVALAEKSLVMDFH